MKPDRPLIVSVACFAAGIGLIIGYCHGAATMNAAFPFSGSMLHFDLTTYGPAVLGGLGLIALGVLLLVWAVLAAFVSQFRLMAGRDERMEMLLEREREGAYDDERYPGHLGITEHKG